MKHSKLLLTALMVFALTLMSEGGVEKWGAGDQSNIQGHLAASTAPPAESATGAPTSTMPPAKSAATPKTLHAEINRLAPRPFEYKKKDSEEITLVAFGDLMLGRYVWILMERNGHDYPFEYFPELLDTMLTDKKGKRADPDFIFANLEGPISDNPYRNPGTAMLFNFKPAVTDIIKKYGFNILSIANNHAFDMGVEGARQTREYLTDAYIHHVGHSKKLRQESVWVTTVKDTKIAFVAFNDTLKNHLNYEAAGEMIRDLEDEVDFTVVSIHWGTEYRTTPTDKQVEDAHAFVDAGADVILGHHPHVIESTEWYNGRPIYYSLGNFVFDQYFQKNVQEGLGVVITLKKSASRYRPDQIQSRELIFDIKNSQPQLRREPASD